MPVTSQRLAQIACDGPYVSAFAAGHFQQHMIRIGAIRHHQFLNPKRAGGDFEIFVVAGKFVGALTVDLHRRKLGRNLHDVADKLTQLILDFIIRRAQVRCRDDFALCVIGIGRLAKGDHEFIGLQRVGDIGNGLGCLAQCNGQNTGCLGVERACVARFFRAHSPADFVHNSGRRHAGRFVHHQPTRNITTFTLAHHRLLRCERVC